MTTSSNIVTTTIDAEYPVPGMDNDTKGFRDNFANIITALETAKTEITELVFLPPHLCLQEDI